MTWLPLARQLAVEQARELFPTKGYPFGYNGNLNTHLPRLLVNEHSSDADLLAFLCSNVVHGIDNDDCHAKWFYDSTTQTYTLHMTGLYSHQLRQRMTFIVPESDFQSLHNIARQPGQNAEDFILEWYLE